MADVHVMVTPEETNLVNRIAGKVYREYCPAGESGQMMIEDLKHYGIIGLIDAKKSFKPSKKVPWLAFAALKIKWKMLDALRKDPTIRLPQEKQKQVKLLKAARKELAKTGINVTSETLAKKLQLSIEEVHHVLNLSPTLIPAEDDRRDENYEVGYGGAVLQDKGPDPESAYMKEELAKVMNKCLKTLLEKDRIVITGKFLEDMKLKDLAEVFNCSIESVRQWQNQALEQMKKCLERHGWSLQDV